MTLQIYQKNNRFVSFIAYNLQILVIPIKLDAQTMAKVIMENKNREISMVRVFFDFLLTDKSCIFAKREDNVRPPHLPIKRLR